MAVTQQEINYVAGRKRYTRPQGIAFAEADNQSTSGLIPAGHEI